MRKDVIEKLQTLLAAAFGLIAALAWNEAVKSLFVEGGPLYFLAAGGVWIYAVFVTLLAVVITIWTAKLAEKATAPIKFPFRHSST